MFGPIFQPSLALGSVILHWISIIKYVSQNVKVTMNLTCVRVNRIVTTVNIRIEKSEKLSHTSVEHFRLTSGFQWQILGIMQI